MVFRCIDIRPLYLSEVQDLIKALGCLLVKITESLGNPSADIVC